MNRHKQTLRKQLRAHSKKYEELCLWLMTNKQKLKSVEIFDFPDYGGMPKRMSSKLTSEDVDRIQEDYELILKTKSAQTLLRVFLDV